jgi:VanZ family protein
MSAPLEVASRIALRVPTLARWLAVGAWAGMIFLASNQPGLAVSDDPGVDKPLRLLAHLAVYAVLTVLLAWAVTGRRLPSPTLAVVCGVVALLYGVSDEWHQTLVPTRTGRVEDLVWDGLGAIVGVVAIVVTGRLTRRAAGPGADGDASEAPEGDAVRDAGR